ncbi:hypothetical protein Purlil1_3570 [Purpureocillium lilacinum]|uniref:Uncharacterized protein n=1 Tax=Purpureocillium lilacinum TaxID=33203 RepID=A0ABR0C7K0_PURLI|nr:hypothetical protein Purlil1_3570 [Purpureocillium lilacinum]
MIPVRPWATSATVGRPTNDVLRGQSGGWAGARAQNTTQSNATQRNKEKQQRPAATGWPYGSTSGGRGGRGGASKSMREGGGFGTKRRVGREASKVAGGGPEPHLADGVPRQFVCVRVATLTRLLAAGLTGPLAPTLRHDTRQDTTRYDATQSVTAAAALARGSRVPSRERRACPPDRTTGRGAAMPLPERAKTQRPLTKP